MILKIFLFVTLLFAAIPNAKATTTARDLQAYCEKTQNIISQGPESISGAEDMFQAGRCMGMVEATLFQYMLDGKKANCRYKPIPNIGAVKIFLNHIAANPENSQNPAAQEIWLSLIAASPCEKVMPQAVIEEE